MPDELDKHNNIVVPYEITIGDETGRAELTDKLKTVAGVAVQSEVALLELTLTSSKIKELEASLVTLVANARFYGHSWLAISKAMEMPQQTVNRKYKDKITELKDVNK